MMTLWADAADDHDINGEVEDTHNVGEGQSRRSFFLTSLPATIGCAATAGAGILAAPRPNVIDKTLGAGAIIVATGKNTAIQPTPTKLKSVGDALSLIEEMCDRKFLHAVVASDYRFLYRGMPLSWQPLPTVVEGEGSDLLLTGTYGEDSLEAVKFFRKLDGAMASKPVRPGANGHLGTTSTLDAATWGSPASIWPLSGGGSDDKYAHFAWYEDGGAFWPRPKAWSKSSKSVDDGIIVDGINCGSVNLEDALRTMDNEIMFSTESYLAIPSEWDKELREGLRNAFIL